MPPAASSCGRRRQTSAAGTSACSATIPSSASGTMLGDARAGHDPADLVQRGLGSVEHEVPRVARLDDAAQNGRDLARAVVAAAPRDEHGLRGEERAERAEPVRPQRAPARDEIDDRVGEPEARRDLDGAGDATSSTSTPALAEEALGEIRVDGRHPRAGEIVQRRRRRLRGNRRLERARAEAEPEEHVDAHAALLDEVGAGHAAVDDLVLDVLGDVGGADEHDVDRRVAAGKRQCTLTGLLGAETRRVEKRDGGLAESALRRDGDGQPARRGVLRARRSSTSRYPSAPCRSHCATRVTVVVEAPVCAATSRYGRP